MSSLLAQVVLVSRLPITTRSQRATYESGIAKLYRNTIFVLSPAYNVQRKLKLAKNARKPMRSSK